MTKGWLDRYPPQDVKTYFVFHRWQTKGIQQLRGIEYDHNVIRVEQPGSTWTSAWVRKGYFRMDYVSALSAVLALRAKRIAGLEARILKLKALVF